MYSSILDRLCDYIEHMEELFDQVYETEKVDFNKEMDELEGVLDKNDVLLTDIKKTLKDDFMARLEAFD